MLDQFELASPPSDIISAVRFAPQGERLLVSSWDRNVYLYEVTSGSSQLVNKHQHRAPVLDVCWGEENNEAYTVGLDWDVRRYRTQLVAQALFIAMLIQALESTSTPAHKPSSRRTKLASSPLVFPPNTISSSPPPGTQHYTSITQSLLPKKARRRLLQQSSYHTNLSRYPSHPPNSSSQWRREPSTFTTSNP